MSKTEPTILTPFLDDADVIVYAGDCIEVMREMPEASVDAIVTDPPYGIGFMGKDWDKGGRMIGQLATGHEQRGAFAYGGSHDRGYADNDSRAFQAFSESWAREAFRILKPGGHLLAFAGTRTYHRMASGVEDAGFEIRDCIAWMYGSGFPKSLDVSKAIDKAAGAEREIIHEIPDRWTGKGNALNFATDRPQVTVKVLGEPATPEAEAWSGWGTALKPAFEPVVVARKPLIGTVAENVLEHGTGALNIDKCRIGTTEVLQGSTVRDDIRGAAFGAGHRPALDVAPYTQNQSGRWPANVALDAEAAALLDEQSGQQKDGTAVNRNRTADNDRARYTSYALGNARGGDVSYGGNGGASRFFYTAKASRQDRNTSGADNTHPTVKPTELMRWLIRLITPPGGIILDPFGGSGSTGVAARAESVRCMLIEREAEYLQIIRDRLAQQTLFATTLNDE